MVFEPAVVHDISEPFKADLPLTDVRMPVNARAEIGFRVVQVERYNLPNADKGSDLANGGLPSLFGADVVTCGEQMRGVEAYRQPFGFGQAIKDFGEVRHSVAEA